MGTSHPLYNLSDITATAMNYISLVETTIQTFYGLNTRYVQQPKVHGRRATVKSHFRLIGFDQSLAQVETATPSEPEVAEDAASLSIDVLVIELPTHGLVDTAPNTGAFGRVRCMLVHDQLPDAIPSRPSCSIPALNALSALPVWGNRFAVYDDWWDFSHLKTGAGNRVEPSTVTTTNAGQNLLPKRRRSPQQIGYEYMPGSMKNPYSKEGESSVEWEYAR
ncbi:hypothetical protein BZA05DRAFT_439764 [Tricharina praecox]|uniref:uncharacterized protein n=1 Tax=Tricharina praecox TaxID=43433 RepID=UPI002220BD5B|nr:uncharacterized protein BZA05DRAFT_439764 [Tricharina praecox]KAI5841324.1 hypothetical protein BZA05DRAFT_439764 [Tricharina praecox]